MNAMKRFAGFLKRNWPTAAMAGACLLLAGCTTAPGVGSGGILSTFSESNTNSRAFKKKVEADNSIPPASEALGIRTGTN